MICQDTGIPGKCDIIVYMLIRLQKYLADCGVASRRKAEELILSGKIRVNGQVVTQLGTKVDPASDKVYLEGRPVKPPAKKIYIKLNKPVGYYSSCVSQKGERTVLDLVQNIPERLYPVGRLDVNSEGLMILTNDGELANRLMHPRYEHEKEYIVNVQLTINNEQLRNLQSGIIIEGKKTLPAKVRQINDLSFSIVLKEGKKRQIRRMVEAAGNKVVGLKRIRLGNLQLGELPIGKSEYLTAQELKDLVSDYKKE